VTKKVWEKSAVDIGSPTRGLSGLYFASRGHISKLCTYCSSYTIIYALSYTPNDFVEEPEAHKWL